MLESPQHPEFTMLPQGNAINIRWAMYGPCALHNLEKLTAQ